MDQQKACQLFFNGLKVTALPERPQGNGLPLRKGREGFELKMSQGCKEILQIVKTSIQGLNGKHVRESFGLELYASLQGFCVQGGEHPSGLTGDQLFACPSAKIVVRPPMIIFCAGNKLS
jgi:hypothetical protein